MTTSRIFNRRIMGLDIGVWRVLIFTVIFSMGLLSYKIFKKDDCTPFKIDIRGNSHLTDSVFFTGDNIKFIASISSEEIIWNFKDNSRGKTKGSYVMHTFTKEGKYYVTANNKECEEGKLITIKNKPKTGNFETHSNVREILGTSSTFAGKIEEYISPALADSFYEWVILSHPEMGILNEEKVKYQFNNPGIYTIQLTLDHNRINSYTKRIFVEDLPKSIRKMPEDVGPLVPKKIPKREDTTKDNPPPPINPTPPPPAIDPSISSKTKGVAPEVFKGYLQKLVENDMNENEFYKYLCSTGTTIVIVNGDRNNPKTFSWLCQELKGKKVKKHIASKKKFITIDAVRLMRDETNCVSKIEVDY